MTKKELFQIMNNKKVKKIAINCFTVDQNEELKQSLIDSLKDNNCTIEDFEETEDQYSIKGYSNFWRKSKLLKEEEGILQVRSKDYVFNNNIHNCYGNIPTKENLIILNNDNEVGFISVLKWIDKEKNVYKGMKYILI